MNIRLILQIKPDYLGFENIFVFRLQILRSCLYERVHGRIVFHDSRCTEIVFVFDLSDGLFCRGDVFLCRQIFLPCRAGVYKSLCRFFVYLFLYGSQRIFGVTNSQSLLPDVVSYRQAVEDGDGESDGKICACIVAILFDERISFIAVRAVGILKYFLPGI